MDRIKKTARELEKTIRIAAPDLKYVPFKVHAEKSVNGWSAAAATGTENIIEVNARLKQIVDMLVALYELQE
jgi:hypothetical protein